MEIERAEAEDKAAPSTSRVLEMLVRKGIKAYKREFKNSTQLPDAEKKKQQ